MVSLQAFRILNKNVPKFLKYRGWFLNPRNKLSRVRARFKIEAHAGKLAVRSSLAPQHVYRERCLLPNLTNLFKLSDGTRNLERKYLRFRII